MKLFLFTIIFLFVSGCKDNIVNHYIDVSKHDTTKVKCDSVGDDDHESGHHHHKKSHLKDREDD